MGFQTQARRHVGSKAQSGEKTRKAESESTFSLSHWSPLRASVPSCLRASPASVLITLFSLLLLTGCEKSIRFATFNGSLSREHSGWLLLNLTNPDDPQAKSMADVIQHQNPDVLLLTDVDYDSIDRARYLFEHNYLAVSQGGAPAIKFANHFTGPANCGIASGYDLDHDGKVVTTPGAPGYAGDAIGFGMFPGQHGMLLLSKFPIEKQYIRTFTRFKWKRIPDAQLPMDANGKPWYAHDALEMMRLASTNFWDVPIVIDGKKVVHVIVNRPTSTATDDAAHRNAKRNHDEIRFLSDYISGNDAVTPSRSYYISDDTGLHGGLEVWSKSSVRTSANVPFIVMGQDNSTNAEPLLTHPLLKENAKSDRPEILPSGQFKITGANALSPAPATQPVSGSAPSQRFVYLDLKF